MNIFKILSSNDGSINEPNVSSFLAYLLDPNENHGLGSKFVESFLSPIILSNKEQYSELIYEDRVRDLSKNSKFNVRVQAEVKVVSFDYGEKRKTRDIDILIELFEQDAHHSLPKFSFCVENKIKDGAIIKGDHQLYEEIVGLNNYYADVDTLAEYARPMIAFIFLTPAKTQRANDEFNELLEMLHKEDTVLPTLHMVWEDAHEPHSIVTLLTHLLELEDQGRIDPIYDYTKHTIKSFVSFIYSGFQSYKEEKILANEKSDYGKTVIQYIKDFYDTVPFDQDILHDDLKEWVRNTAKEVSGVMMKNGNFDGSYVINERNRRHYGITSPYKPEKNLFYYPNESNKKVIRKLDPNNLPAGIMIYWKDTENPDRIGEALVRDVLQ
ncbi:hypothetical protein D3C76_510810 [compost metagenome]